MSDLHDEYRPPAALVVLLLRLKVFKFSKLRLSVSALTAAGFLLAVPLQTKAQTFPEVGSVFRDCPECPEMVVIPAGEFLMGSSAEEAKRDIEASPSSDVSSMRKVVATEQPQHSVVISAPFALGKFPVTKDELAVFVKETGYGPPRGCVLYALQYHISPEADWRFPGFTQTERDPVVCVNWHDANAYVEWLNKKAEKRANSVNDGPYRLPSEAELEYAARAGTRTARWWGDSIGLKNANCARCGSKWDQRQTAPVGSFPPNPFGLYDILGNVTQWTEDCWNESYAGAPTDGKPWTKGNCERRLARGGNFAAFPAVIRSATRFGLFAESRVNLGGFRVAKTLRPSIQ